MTEDNKIVKHCKLCLMTNQIYDKKQSNFEIYSTTLHDQPIRNETKRYDTTRMALANHNFMK